MKWPHMVNIWTIFGTLIFAISLVSFQLETKPETIDHLKQQLHDGCNYLKLTFKTHVSQKNRVGDHCSTFALSDPGNPSWRQKCDHDNNEEYYLREYRVYPVRLFASPIVDVVSVWRCMKAYNVFVR